MSRQPRKGPPSWRRSRVLGAALSLVAHLSLLIALLWSWPDAPRAVDPQAVAVQLVGEPPPSPKPASSAAPAAPAAAAKAKPTPRRAVAIPAPKPTAVSTKSKTRDDDEPDPSDTAPALTEAQLAGAAVAGTGEGSGAGSGAGTGGGRVCDMAGRVQNALRRDPLVRAAVANAAGRATMVWNGDWVRSSGEDGKGLAAVREAIMWEVAFAPDACRTQPVRGLVLLSVNGVAGPTRLALGAGAWRWSDLLTPRPGVPGEASNR